MAAELLFICMGYANLGQSRIVQRAEEALHLCQMCPPPQSVPHSSTQMWNQFLKKITLEGC